MILHPIFVHFPIAFLTLYSLLELCRWQRLTRLPFWLPLKGVLVVLGTVGAFAAILTGQVLEPQFANDPLLRQVVETHSSWARNTLLIFTCLSIVYIVALVNAYDFKLLTRFGFIRAANDGAIKFLASLWVVPLALLGLVAITITGALGGSIVYGPSADPFVQFIYQLYGFQ